VHDISRTPEQEVSFIEKLCSSQIDSFLKLLFVSTEVQTSVPAVITFKEG
jgi:hypothetical protein